MSQQVTLHLTMPNYILKVLVFVLFVLRSDFSFSQWQLVSSGTPDNIVDICFPTDSIGYAVTDNGNVLKTVDEGNNWSVITTLGGSFTSICAIGVDTIFVGGNVIFRSDDGGNSWINLITLGYTITDLLFFNAQSGIYIKPGYYTCSSSQGTVTISSFEALSTNDSGNTWSFSFSNLQPFSRIQLVNDSTAYVNCAEYYIIDHCSGYYSNHGMKTSDNGATWSYYSMPGLWYSAFSFVNDTLGYIFEGFPPGSSLWRENSLVQTQVRQLTIGVEQLVFINKIDGYILSGNDIYKTNSEGLVWYIDTIPTTSSLNMLYNDHNKAMFAIGANGTILRNEIIESLYPDSIYAMAANQSQLQFDTTIVGGSMTKPLIIRNDGSVSLNIQVSASNIFRVSTSSNNFGSSINFTLPAQRDSIVNIKFNPSDSLHYQDTLVVSADSVNSIYIPLDGFGTRKMIGYLSDSIYLCEDTIDVIGNFIIEDGGKLVICPGTVINFKGSYILKVLGTLIAEGLPNDSIVFSPEDNAIGWKGISFDGTSSLDTSVLRYCTLSYASQAVQTIVSRDRTNLIIDHCSIHNGRGGIYSEYGAITICNNKIFNNGVGNNFPGCGVKLFYDSSRVINNVIFNNIASNGAGIWMLNHAPGSPQVIQNLIFNNTSANASGVYICYGSPSLINNTISNNKATSPSNVGGVYVFQVDSNTLALNNIIYNNSGTQLYTNSAANLNVAYCDIQGGYSSGIGNINQNPQFVNPTDSLGVMFQIGNYDWSLMPNSLCINAGDTSFHSLIPIFDIAGNPRVTQGRIEIGAYEYQQFVSINENESVYSISVYPNPFIENLNIIATNNQEELEFVLYDLFSRIIFQQKFAGSLIISTGQLANGIYIYEIRDRSGLCNKGKVLKD